VSIEEAAHRLSYLPADMAGLKTRGLIKEGYDTDIAVFDWERLTGHADYLNPKAKNDGMINVIVNGRIAFENDSFTGTHAGKYSEKCDAHRQCLESTHQL
jgi:N-acyl-D-amino-acid deacylase